MIEVLDVLKQDEVDASKVVGGSASLVEVQLSVVEEVRGSFVRPFDL